MNKLVSWIKIIVLILLTILMYAVLAAITATPIIAFFVGLHWVGPKTFFEKIIFFVILLPVLWLQLHAIDLFISEFIVKMAEKLKEKRG